MIQRPQSLFLLLGAVALVALFFLDIVWRGPTADSYDWFTPAILILAGIIGLGAIGTIFLYQDRQRQKRIVVWLQFATVFFLFVFYGSLYMMGDLHFMRDGATDTGKVIALALPIFAYVMFFMARRGIIHDIKLVRSMDRLR
jgi:uncharacterized membrane protein